MSETARDARDPRQGPQPCGRITWRRQCIGRRALIETTARGSLPEGARIGLQNHVTHRQGPTHAGAGERTRPVTAGSHACLYTHRQCNRGHTLQDSTPWGDRDAFCNALCPPLCAVAYRLDPLQQLPWIPSSELEIAHDG